MYSKNKQVVVPPSERKMFNAIRWQLALLNALVLTVILAILEIGIYIILSSSLYRRVDNLLLSQANQLARLEVYRNFFRWGRFPSRPAPIAMEGMFYLVLDEQGIIIVNPQAISLDNLPDKESITQAVAGEPVLRTVHLGDGQRVRLYTVAMREGGRIIGVLQIGRSLTAEEHTLWMLQLLFLASGFMGIVLSTVGGLFLAERAMVPIRAAFKRQQDFVADASHELRTPLTLIRANAEIIARHPELPVSANADLLADILTEIDRLSRLVNDLLVLARADAGQEGLDIVDFAMDDLVRETARQFAPLAEKRGLALRVFADQPVKVRGDVAKLRQLLMILLDNAVKYTPAGGEITVCCQRSTSGGRLPVTLTVSDTGPGIAPEHLPHIFERFYRADKARTHDGGAGLGLAIAHWIVTAHKGRIQATSAPGQGTTFAVQLPG